jgi:hypothetical protein
MCSNNVGHLIAKTITTLKGKRNGQTTIKKNKKKHTQMKMERESRKYDKVIYSVKHNHHHHHHHHHHLSVMELGHLLTRSGLTYPEVSQSLP